jgi:WD40 repeat protein
MKKLIYWLLGAFVVLTICNGDALAAEQGMRLEKALKLPGASATSLAMSNDGIQALVGMGKDGIALVNLKNLKAPYVVKHIPLEGQVDSVAYNGRLAFVALSGGEIATVDLKQGKISEIRKLKEFADAKIKLALSPQGDQLLVMNAEKSGLIDLRTKVTFDQAPLKMIDFKTENNSPNPVSGTFSPDGKSLAIVLQKNNMIGLVNRQTGEVEKIFSLGETKHRADLVDDDFPLIEEIFVARLEPSEIAFSSNGQFIYTVNEGAADLPTKTNGVWSGGRNFSIFKIDGTLAFDGLDKLEQTALMLGVYSDKFSPVRGIEPNVVANGRLYDKPAIAIGARHTNGVFFFQTTFPDKPFFYGMVLSSGKTVEAVAGLGKRDGFISVDQSGMLSIYLPTNGPKEVGTGH